jgi:hypothetical protein
VVLPALGLIVFAGISWHSYRNPREGKAAVGRYFSVGSVIHLDSHPPPERPPEPCDATKDPCVSWGIPDISPPHPGTIERIFTLCALPAFFIRLFITSVLGRLGINQILSFMISLPLLIFGWLYFVGWPLTVGASSVWPGGIYSRAKSRIAFLAKKNV